ncbi:hypothetical protein TNCV_288071 [Trichonephila clavipes]|nr:hypothetical protein TNCV_288071 [Trichonephila clavipes]
MVSAGITLNDHTYFHVFARDIVITVKHRDEVLEPYVHLFTVASGSDFILMDDNARHIELNWAMISGKREYLSNRLANYIQTSSV